MADKQSVRDTTVDTFISVDVSAEYPMAPPDVAQSIEEAIPVGVQLSCPKKTVRRRLTDVGKEGGVNCLDTMFEVATLTAVDSWSFGRRPAARAGIA
jgi:hypothetical protein